MSDWFQALPPRIQLDIMSSDPMSRFRGLDYARTAVGRDSPLQATLGPLEHGAYTEGVVRQNPLAAPGLAMRIPIYTGLKSLGMFPQARSPASLLEMQEAYRGLFRGLQPKQVYPDPMTVWGSQ